MTSTSSLTSSDHPITRSPDHRIPSGIYVHLPYCRSRCGYCAFVVSTDDSTSKAYGRAVERESALLEAEARDARFDTLYLGGGTPSLTPPEDLVSLLEALRRRFPVLPGAEITLEANPDDVTPELSRRWSNAGVTRVSVGVQSFEDRELRAVGRRHDAATAARSLATLAESGLSISGDLILGLPEQDAASFRASLSRLADCGVQHVSVYLLEVEKSRTIEQDRRVRPDRYLSDDAQADAWLEMGETLAGRGFRHYEVSNWALPGFEARHNVKYWKRVETLGLGVSAHELWNGRRRANVSALPRYIEEIGAGRRPLALDQGVDAREEGRERIVLGLRLEEGVAAGEILEAIRDCPDSTLAGDYEGWRDNGLLEESHGRIRFTERGFLLSNEILCRFV
jgi:putative oxygen-independent coproporphyrinogen III oxidase